MSKPINDDFAFANVIHELVSGMRINKLDSGKYLFHAKVKNSPYFKHVERLINQAAQSKTVDSVVKDRDVARERLKLEKKHNPKLSKSVSCP